MSIDQGFLGQVALFALLFAFGFYVNRIDQRVKAIKNQLGRLSLTFLKIENDLSAIQDSLLLLSQTNSDVASRVAKVRDRRAHVFRHLVAEGPSSAEILRGLELPDIDDDPTFWADDRMKRFGFEETDVADDERVG